MKIVIVVGARPNFMKAAPLIAAIREHNERNHENSSMHGADTPGRIECCLVHTGQHYDETMSGAFFADLQLPAPDIHLAVGSASHAVQTAEIMARFEAVLLDQQPDAVVVVGDVNSTVACALVAAKIPPGPTGRRPLIAHVEAGLRSFDRDMPEEINRVVTDHLSDLLFVTEDSGRKNLLREGIPEAKVHFVGNTMIDSLLTSEVKAEQSPILHQLGLRTDSSNDAASRYALLTLHRPGNVDHRGTFLNILEGLQQLSNSCPVLFPVHPRTEKRIAEFGLDGFFFAHGETRPTNDSNHDCKANGVHLLSPLGYLDFLCLMKHAVLVITDSGGIQEETTCLGVPCVTVRDNTERPVTLTCGTNVIAGTQKEKIRIAVSRQMKGCTHSLIPEKWDGHAGKRIVSVMLGALQVAGATDKEAEQACSPVVGHSSDGQ